jgi:hypothetical protein
VRLLGYSLHETFSGKQITDLVLPASKARPPPAGSPPAREGTAPGSPSLTLSWYCSKKGPFRVLDHTDPAGRRMEG